MYNEDGSNGKKKLNETQKNRIISDERKKTYAENNNYKYVAIWEHSINNEDYSKIEEIFNKKFS